MDVRDHAAYGGHNDDHELPRASGEVDNSIDISNEGQGPYSLGQAMSNEAASNDLKEKQAGTRFHDSGERIPGRQKGANDRYNGPSRITPVLR